MRQKQRERIAEILSNSYPCNHCQKLFDETELFPMMGTFNGRPPPVATRSQLHGDYTMGYYLFCRECIRIYNGSPVTNMVQTGMRRK